MLQNVEAEMSGHVGEQVLASNAMTNPEWLWRSPPNWPPPPPGWKPPPGWRPPPEWPSPPAGWSYWQAPPVTDWTQEPSSGPVVLADGPERRSLVWETWFVMVAFLLPSVSSAIILFVQHVSGDGNITRFPVIVAGHPLTNLIVGILSYLSVAAVVPLALLLLIRTGQAPSVLGLGMPRWAQDIWPGLGLAAASFGAEIPLLLALSPLIAHHSSLDNSIPIGHVPGYYVIWGIAISATTAIAEEVLVNGYLITRLGQLGWTPKSALILSLCLRTSYHVYYGIGFLLTVPFGYFVTRSFQKHHRLNRSIAAHFIYDAVLTTIAILA
jgi:membrane protease YdiL (CAAX protease family)